MSLLVALAVGYLTAGLSFAAVMAKVLPPEDRRDRWVLVSYVPLWPIPALALLVDFLDWPRCTR